MSEKNNGEEKKIINKKRIIFWFLFCIIGIIDIVILIVFKLFFKEFSIFSVGVIGIFTFFGILMFLNYLTGDKNICQGEMRKAITISFIVVYFALLSLSTINNLGISYTGMFQTMIEHFSYLVGIVVVFYFGSRSVEKYIDTKKHSNNA